MRKPSLRQTLMATAMLAATVAAAPHPASAETRVSLRSGHWEAFDGTADDGTPVCGISTRGRNGRYFGIKYFDGEQSLVVHLASDSWSFPRGTTMRIALQFGEAEPWSATATGRQRLLEARVSGAENVRGFIGEFSSAQRGRIEFDGDEGAWSMSLDGSRQALDAMADCMRRMAAGGGGARPQARGGGQSSGGTKVMGRSNF